MNEIKIGITEAGDAGLDLSWANKMNEVEGAILITKHVNFAFSDLALKYREKVIVHATCTGYGGTVLEPNVPKPKTQLQQVLELVRRGFPQNQVVIRVDPILPTEKGLERALRVIKSFMLHGFARYRVSLIDMYRHVQTRFREAGLENPYGDDRFSPRQEDFENTDAMLGEAAKIWTDLGNSEDLLRIESCAEPGLWTPIPCGCVSGYDVTLMRLDALKLVGCQTKGQRKECLCYEGKTELLKSRHPCNHGCLYCYWKE